MQLNISSIAMHAVASMGINAVLFQTGIVTRLKLHTTVPAKIFARLNINEGNFQIGALPVTLPKDISVVQ